MRIEKKYIVIILSLLLLQIKAQEKNYNEEFNAIFIQANEEYNYENYSVALPLFKQLYETDSTNFEVNYKLGTCIFYTKRDKLESLKYFEKAKLNYIDSYYYLGRLYRLNQAVEKSLNAFNIYQNSTEPKLYNENTTNYYIEKTVNAKEMIGKITEYTVKNIGKTINSAYPEYGPLISSNGDYLYFTSRRNGGVGNLKDPNNEYFEDVYVSKLENGIFGNPVNLGQPLNSASHDATVCISNDAKVLYIYRTNKMMTGGDIFTSQIEGDKYSIPQIIEAEINSQDGVESSAYLAPDQKTLYFSSNRSGGYGGKDIYKVVKLPNEKWSKAMNLGSIINSQYDEDAPFIQADGVTLFFSSRGHKNMGGYDVFKTVKNENENWTFPENLGCPINSVADDIFFVANPEETTGYFSSNRLGGFGETDIYKVEFPEIFTENLFLKGRVECEKTGLPLKATITIVDYDTKELQGIYRTSGNSGKFIMVLLPKRHYKLIVETDGYHSYIDDIDMTDKLRINDLFKNIKMQAIDNE